MLGILEKGFSWEKIVFEICDEPIFGRRMVVLGRCGLPKGHPGKCAMNVQTKPLREQQVLDLDFDLDPPEPHDACDTWKPGRDIPPV